MLYLICTPFFLSQDMHMQEFPPRLYVLNQYFFYYYFLLFHVLKFIATWLWHQEKNK